MPEYYRPEQKQPIVKPKASQHDSYMTMSVLTVLMPGVGFILGLVYLMKDKPVDRKLGEHLVAFSILITIIFGALWLFLIQSFQANAQL
jgi:hypothetical protein